MNDCAVEYWPWNNAVDPSFILSFVNKFFIISFSSDIDFKFWGFLDLSFVRNWCFP